MDKMVIEIDGNVGITEPTENLHIVENEKFPYTEDEVLKVPAEADITEELERIIRGMFYSYLRSKITSSELKFSEDYHLTNESREISSCLTDIINKTIIKPMQDGILANKQKSEKSLTEYAIFSQKKGTLLKSRTGAEIKFSTPSEAEQFLETDMHPELTIRNKCQVVKITTTVEAV